MMPLVFLFLVACSDKGVAPADTGSGPTDDTEAVDSADTNDTSLDTSAPTIDGDAPVIQSCDAWCEHHTTGDEYWKWTFSCQATDPDGLDNIWNGRNAVLRNGTNLVEGLMACEPGTGHCTTSFREETHGILCAQASTYTFVAWIQDWDQHESAAFSATGRQQ